MNRHLFAWFFIGFCFALFFQYLRVVSDHGGWNVLIRVPENTPLVDYFRAELHEIDLRPDQHDGVFSYIIARNPFSPPKELHGYDDWGYRYRRILYSLLAGGFGTFSPTATLIGLIFWSAIGMGLVSASFRSLTPRASPLFQLSVLAQPGLIYSTIFLTSDVLALGLTLLGLSFFKRPFFASICLACAVLTKETLILVPLALSAYLCVKKDYKSALQLFLFPTISLVAWMTYITLFLPTTHGGIDRLDWPLMGIFSLISERKTTFLGEILLQCTALVGALFSLFQMVRTEHQVFKWLLLPWSLLFLFSGPLIWEFGNSSLRVFAPMFVLALLSLQRKSCPL